MVIYHLVNIYKQGKHIFQMGGNDNLFDFTYVENVAHGHLLAAEALLQTHSGAAKLTDEEKVDGEAFFITNDAPVYFWDFSRAVWRAAGANNGTQGVWHIPRELGLVLGSLSEAFFWIIRKPPTFNRQRILFSCMTRYYDITKAKRRLGYRPLVALGEGIRRSVKWQLDQESAKLSEKAPVDL
jgi:sterol-4alpha-carboxylate 3-dehydrogenase (decarboxylating)